MKGFLALILVFLYFLSSFSPAMGNYQTLYSEESTEFQSIHASPAVVGKIGSYYYAIDFLPDDRGQEIHLHQYSDQLTPLNSETFLKSPRQVIARSFLWDSSIVILYHEYIPEEKGYKLKGKILSKELSTSKTVQLKPPVQYKETPPPLSYDLQKGEKQLSVIYPSGDSSYSVSSYDKALEKVGRINIKSPELQESSLQSITSVYPHFVATFHQNSLHDTEEPDKLKIVTGQWNTGEEPKITPIENDQFYAYEGEVKYNPVKERFHFAGFYYDEPAQQKQGFVTGYWAPQKEGRNFYFTSIADDDFFLRQPTPEEEPTLENLHFIEGKARSDGGIIMITELRTLAERPGFSDNFQNFPFRERSETLNFQDIKVVSFNREGEIDWHNVVKKDQGATQEPRFQSLVAAFDPTNAHIFYYLGGGLQATFHIQRISREGIRTSKILQDALPQNFTPLVRSGVQTGPSEMVIPLEEKNTNQHRLFKISW